MNREIICIMCPLGCRMHVHVEGQEVQQVEGERCKKGAKYAQQEVTFPGRILTTTVTTDTPEMPLLPVRSDKALPKESLMECMSHISKHSLKKKSRFRIIASPVNCVGCRLCQMRCSFRFTKSFSFSASKIEVVWNEKQHCYEINFNELCDSCGLCVRSCVYGALTLEKESKAWSAR